MEAPLVLAADDDELILVLVRASLEEAGYAVVTVRSGEAALAVLERERPHALVVDMHMPGLDGSQIAARVREREREQGQEPMPILVLTGTARDTEVIDCLAAGADDYLAKPFDPPELAARVALLLEQRTTEHR